MVNRSCVAAVLVLAAACSDRNLTTPDETPVAALPASPAAGPPVELARMVAKGLKNPAFRAYLKAQLDASPYREHKLQFETFLTANGARALRQIAGENGGKPELVERQAKQAIALEVYFPIAEHAGAWSGDERVLVATALRDADVPVAFDVEGRQLVLDPKTPPATPVLALVPVETDFSIRPPRQTCLEDCGGGGGGVIPPPPPAPGLYMTKSHFVQDFEGWLKGSPEFEVHILGQKGQTDSLMDYQCAGRACGWAVHLRSEQSRLVGACVAVFEESARSVQRRASESERARVRRRGRRHGLPDQDRSGTLPAGDHLRRQCCTTGSRPEMTRARSSRSTTPTRAPATTSGGLLPRSSRAMTSS